MSLTSSHPHIPTSSLFSIILFHPLSPSPRYAYDAVWFAAHGLHRAINSPESTAPTGARVMQEIRRVFFEGVTGRVLLESGINDRSSMVYDVLNAVSSRNAIDEVGVASAGEGTFSICSETGLIGEECKVASALPANVTVTLRGRSEFVVRWQHDPSVQERVLLTGTSKIERGGKSEKEREGCM